MNRIFILSSLISLIGVQALANPVRSAAGAMHNAYALPVEEDSEYVTDGMVAWWDAEWNVGIGEHESNPTVWVNLVGNGLDMISNGNPIFYDNYIQPTQQSEMWHTEVTDLMDDALENATLTMEVVGECKVGRDQSKFFIFGGSASDVGISVLGVCVDEWRIGISTWVGGVRVFIFGHQNPLGYRSVSCDGMTITGRYMSSSGMLTRSAGARVPITNYASKRFAIGYRYNYYPDSPMANGEKVYCIRVYNRGLTEKEIMHNYAIDKMRFGL